MDTKRMRISCRRCQLRKLKCTRIHPCSSCVSSGSECNFRDDDTRRRPVSRHYVAALEERIASYETMLRNLQQASPDQRQNILTHTAEPSTITDPEALTTHVNPVFDYTGSSRRSTLTLQPGPQGCLSFYGPTSIYQKDCITANHPDSNESQSERRFEQWQDFRLSRSLNVSEATIQKGLIQLFLYQGAECPFIDHETFTDDFVNHRHNNKYWSYPLLFTLCSLGLRLGADPTDKKDAESLARCSHEMLSMSCLEKPHITVVQSLLTLAFVELGASNHVQGWMLSGMAFRMGQDMGLHQDPRFLVDENKAFSMKEDFRFRRRVYWGCYVADKLISLYFGRPMALHEMDAAVNPPDPTWATTRSEGPLDATGYLFSTIPLPDEKDSLACFINLVELCRIIESVMSMVFSTKLIKKPRKELVLGRIASVEELNVRLFRWQSGLPEELAWNQWTPSTQSLMPQAAVIHALYHSTLISLNRHFIRPTPGFSRRAQSREICIASAESIMAIIRQYRSQHSLVTAPLTLVYSTVMAATAVSFALDTTTLGQAPASEFETHMKFLLKSLKELSTVYRIAHDASARLEAVLTKGQERTEEDPNFQFDQEKGDPQVGSLFEWPDWQDLDVLDPENSGLAEWPFQEFKEGPASISPNAEPKPEI